MSFDAVFRSRRSNVLARHGMVATSQPLAAQAGLAALQAGGTAADAAVTMAAMLSVVEPMSIGVGGDCFALYWDASSKQVTALNGSGRAAAAASIEELRSLGYERMPSYTGHTVSVPGAVAGWCDLLERHGRMSLPDVLEPAIRAAEQGYPVSELIARAWAGSESKLLRSPTWQNPDLPRAAAPPQPSGHELLVEGRAPRWGEVVRLLTLAETLRGISQEGKRYIYHGEFARKISEHVQHYGGWITPADLASHTSTWEKPIAAHYRGHALYECPPNGHGLAAILAANMAAGYDLRAMDQVERLHILIECMRLAFADALHWVSDMHVVDIPLSELCGPAYADRRRRLIDSARAARCVKYDSPLSGSDTAYMCAVDGDGNACSFIGSLYLGMGTGLVVPGTGVALQNRASLFVLEPEHPNALAPRKRPYHTIIPAMTTRQSELHSAFGVMGGFMQPHGHLQMLVNMVDLDMSPQLALDVPRWRLALDGRPGVGAEDPGGLLYIEEGWPFEVMAALAQRGHHLAPVGGFARRVFGGGQIIVRDPETRVLTAGSEPRKDGCAVGY
jgi:gamma-glutamyltranspeptidase/glutathione hydrolase